MWILERISRTSRGSDDQIREAPGSLEVVVLHTTMKETLQALPAAARLADGLAAQIRLLVLETVPYTLPVNQPQVGMDFTKCRFRTVAADARIDTHVDIRLGRDYQTLLESALKPRSLIVIGGKRGGWLSRHRRLARRLEHQGHHVVFAATK